MPTDFDTVEIDPLPEQEPEKYFGMVLWRDGDFVSFLVTRDVTAVAIEEYYRMARRSLADHKQSKEAVPA